MEISIAPILSQIPGYEKFTKIEPVNKGWSSDQKFYIETSDGRRLLLRVADFSAFERKKAEFSMIQRAATLDIALTRPIDFGLCDEGRRVFSLLTWLDGEDLEAALPLCSKLEQYTLGTKAGELLQKLHTLPAPEDIEPWHLWFRRKVQHRIDFYVDSPIRSVEGDKIARYLQEQQDVLIGRPQTFNHGDFNTSNLIVSPKGQVGVIDFNYFNLDHGDPWWEFDAIAWGQEPCGPFYTGMIHRYFNGEPPREFFEVLSYYLAYDGLAALCDTSVGEQGEPEDGRKHVTNILRWSDDLNNPIPAWYQTFKA